GSSSAGNSAFFFRRDLLEQGRVVDFQFLELALQLLGLLPPLGPALTHIVHTILEAFGLGLQVLVLALPTVPTPAQEPGLNSVRGCVPLCLTVIVTCHVHRELLFDSVSVDLLKAKAQQNRRNQARPKPLKQLGLSSAHPLAGLTNAWT